MKTKLIKILTERLTERFGESVNLININQPSIDVHYKDADPLLVCSICGLLPIDNLCDCEVTKNI